MLAELAAREETARTQSDEVMQLQARIQSLQAELEHVRTKTNSVVDPEPSHQWEPLEQEVTAATSPLLRARSHLDGEEGMRD